MTESTLPLIVVLGEERSRWVGILTVQKGEKKSRLPLAGVELSARVADRVAEVKAIQKFHNPFSEHLEAVYTFPLPGGAAVTSFKMRVGDRVIVGKVDERAQARQQYVQAIQTGHRAALMEQERDDVFTVQVGNLPPGEEVTIEISYSERLSFFENGTTEIRLPLVVAPRYIPGEQLPRDQVGLGIESDTDIVPDASRITPPRLAKGFDPKVSLSIAVELLPSSNAKSSGLADLSCSQHAVSTVTADGVVTVSLMNDKEHLDRDFVLVWRLAEKKLTTGFIYYEDTVAKECYGMLSIIPPGIEIGTQRPRDVVFVLDRSGSMAGVKMVSAVRACSILLNALGPSDRLAILAFDDRMEWMNGNMVPSQPWEEAVSGVRASDAHKHFMQADEAGIIKANEYLRTITSRGGTEIGVALKHAFTDLDGLAKQGNRAEIVVLLTDGQVGQESQVLRELQVSLGDKRLFTVGIDTAVNEGFLKHAASMGRGTATFVQPGAQLEKALVNVAREIGEPILTDLTLQGAGLEEKSIVPCRFPDVFVGRASSCFFKFKLDPKKEPRFTIGGSNVGQGKFEEELKGRKIPLKAIAQLWAKQYVVDLEDQFRLPGAHQDALKKEIISVSVRHSILTRFTAFVVVDEAEVVNAGGDNRTVVQPVEQPAQWAMSDGAVDQLFIQNLGVNTSQHMSRQRATTQFQDANNAWGAPAAPQFQGANEAWGAPAASQFQSAPARPSQPSPAPASRPSLPSQPSPAPMPFSGSPANQSEQPLTLSESIRRKMTASESGFSQPAPMPGSSGWGGTPGQPPNTPGSTQDQWDATSSGSSWETSGTGWGQTTGSASGTPTPDQSSHQANTGSLPPAPQGAPAAGLFKAVSITRQDVLNALVRTAAMGSAYEPDWTPTMQAHGISKTEIETGAQVLAPKAGGAQIPASALSATAWEFARQFRALCGYIELHNTLLIDRFDASRWALYQAIIVLELQSDKMRRFLANEASEILRLCIAQAPPAELKAAIQRITPVFQEALDQLNALLSEKEKGAFWEASI